MTEHTRDDVAPAPLVVAVDGPSGSGKSSVSKAVARRLGAAYLDTGAMYRAVAWHCLNEGVDLADAEAVAAAAVAMDLDQSTDPDVEAVRVGGTDVTEAIRGPEVTDTVSSTIWRMRTSCSEITCGASSSTTATSARSRAEAVRSEA